MPIQNRDADEIQIRELVNDVTKGIRDKQERLKRGVIVSWVRYGDISNGWALLIAAPDEFWPDQPMLTSKL